MILNFIILGFVLFMAYWWGNQGAFSAILHTAAVVTAGSLAFATWELWTVSVFMKLNAANAWGVGLLIPFVIYLQVFRLSYDKLIKSNVHFTTMINMIVGGLFGFISAVLAAGIVVVGISYMSLGPNILGYQPFLLGPDGRVSTNAGGALWIPVDSMSSNFYAKLSMGSFSNDTPLKKFMPDLVQQAGTFRMHVDGNATLVAKPGSIELVGSYTAKTPFTATDDTLIGIIGNEIRKGNHRILVFDTKWLFTKPPYNGVDSTLRISPTQVQLITYDVNDPDTPTQLIQPIGASKVTEEGQRSFIAFKDAQTMIAGTNPQADTIAFLFIIPQTRAPGDLLIRRQRVHVPDLADSSYIKDEPQITTVLGRLDESQTAVANTDTPEEGSIGNRQGNVSGMLATEISLSNKLPKQFSKNRYTGPMNYNSDNQILTINAEGVLSHENVSQANAIKEFYVPSHKAMVRVLVDLDKAQSLLGRSYATAAMVNSQVTLIDDKGSKWQPSGYALLQEGKIRVLKDPDHPLRVAKQLPIADMRKGEELYLYFEVDRGRVITRYELGHANQDVRLTVPE
ncbi:MAG TPA: hypothetical protein DER01_06110 [Phycisphaerales bacterium]|nr:hypothetical protein [Phycisphaerales bacterium]|tara:strand:+ start:484 stop:2184 length:1701 start_codon:yes stop_codon:yes gene_type:complete